MTAGESNVKLENAFLKLISEKPFARITVNDIVQEAGVHRNTFYYHYQSIPAMLSVIGGRMTDKMFTFYQDVQSPADCILPLIRYSKSNRTAILHLYDSEARPILMEYVRKIGRFAIEQYIDNVSEDLGVSRQDRQIMVRFYTAGMVGVWTEWVEEGMETDSSEDFIRIGNILERTTLVDFNMTSRI